VSVTLYSLYARSLINRFLRSSCETERTPLYFEASVLSKQQGSAERIDGIRCRLGHMIGRIDIVFEVFEQYIRMIFMVSTHVVICVRISI